MPPAVDRTPHRPPGADGAAGRRAARGDHRRRTARERLAAAGMTWEALAGWLQGPMDAAAWEAVIPSMGAMALRAQPAELRRGRGLGRGRGAGRGEDLATRRWSRASRQFPFRYLAAVPARPVAALGVPAGAGARPLAGQCARAARPDADPGRPLGLHVVAALGPLASSTGPTPPRSSVRRWRCGRPTPIWCEFGTSSAPVTYRKGESVLKVLGRFGDLGGTNTDRGGPHALHEATTGC